MLMIVGMQDTPLEPADVLTSVQLISGLRLTHGVTPFAPLLV